MLYIILRLLLAYVNNFSFPKKLR